MRSNLSRRNSCDDLYINDSAAEERRHERQDRRLSKSEWCPDRTHDQHDWDDDYSAYTSASSNMSDRRYGNRVSTKESMNLRSSTGGLGQGTDSRSFDFYRHVSDGDGRYADEERDEERVRRGKQRDDDGYVVSPKRKGWKDEQDRIHFDFSALEEHDSGIRNGGSVRTHMRSNLSRRNSCDDLYINDSAAEERRHERQDRRLSKSEWCPDRTHDQHDWDDDYSAYTSASSNMSDRRYGNRVSTKESMNLRSSTGGLGQGTDSRSFDFYRHVSDGDGRYADEERDEERVRRGKQRDGDGYVVSPVDEGLRRSSERDINKISRGRVRRPSVESLDDLEVEAIKLQLKREQNNKSKRRPSVDDLAIEEMKKETKLVQKKRDRRSHMKKSRSERPAQELPSYRSSSQHERVGSPSSSSDELDNNDSLHSFASVTIGDTVAAETVDDTVAVVINGAPVSNANDVPIPRNLGADNLEATGDTPRSEDNGRRSGHKSDLDRDKKESSRGRRSKSRRRGKSRGHLRLSGNSIESLEKLSDSLRQLNMKRSSKRSRRKSEKDEYEPKRSTHKRSGSTKSSRRRSSIDKSSRRSRDKSRGKSVRSRSRKKTNQSLKGDLAGQSLPSGEPTSEKQSTTKNAKRPSFRFSQTSQGAQSGDKPMRKIFGRFVVERKWCCMCCLCFWLVLVVCAVGGWFILGALQKEGIVEYSPEDKNEVDDKAVLFSSAAEPSQMPSQYPSAEPSDTQPKVTIIVMVQLDEDPDSVAFSLQSADNTTTYISREVGSLTGLYYGQIVEPVLINSGTEVMFTFSGNGQYQIIKGYGDDKVTLISNNQGSSYSFTAGLDNAKRINVEDPNEYCLPCDAGNCGRCAWCEADKGFKPDVVYAYRCLSGPRSIPEKCFFGDKRVQLINQHIEQIADCKEGFTAKPKYSEFDDDINLCVDEVFCMKKFYLQPDCDAELPGSTMVTETCQDLIGGEVLGYNFTRYAPRKGDCISETSFSADIAPRCCSDGVAFCSQHAFEGTSFGEESPILNQPTRAPVATISSAPTSSLLPTWDGFPITVAIQLDRFPKETGLTLRSLDGRFTYIDKPPGSFVKPLDLVFINLQIPLGTEVELQVTDSQGDGFEGYFQVYSVSGSLLVDESGLSFESAISKTFVVDEPETLRPTGSPVPTASSEPTQDLYPITIELQLDRWSSETSMIIKSLWNLETLVNWTFTDEHSSQLVRETVMLPSGIDVAMTLFDEDGFCCLYGDGYVKVLDGDAAVIFDQDADFGTTLEIPFRVGPVSAGTTPDHASMPPSVGFVDLTLVLQLDQFPAETSWTITSIDDGTVYESRSDGYYESIKDKNIVETFRLPGGHAYRFIIKDLMGDGFCCSEGNGYYSLYMNDFTLLFHSSADFGLQAEHNFVTLEAPSPPTASPSEKESPVPSGLPTLALHEVQFSFHLDSHSVETGFRIIAPSGAVLLERLPGYFAGRDNLIVLEVVLLPGSTYTLQVLDSAGDGFCCSSGVGLYTVLDISTGDLLLFGRGTFESEMNSTFSVSGLLLSKSSPMLRGASERLRHRAHADE